MVRFGSHLPLLPNSVAAVSTQPMHNFSIHSSQTVRLGSSSNDDCAIARHGARPIFPIAAAKRRYGKVSSCARPQVRSVSKLECVATNNLAGLEFPNFLVRNLLIEAIPLVNPALPVLVLLLNRRLNHS